jgi:hypothetical protein
MNAAIVSMNELYCAECGAVFAISEYLWECKRRDDKPVHCPNGHENFYKSKKQLGEEEDAVEELKKVREQLAATQRETVSLKEMLVTIRSRCEQAEARAGIVCSEASNIAPSLDELQEESASSFLTPNTTDPPKELVILRVGKRVRCPFCEKTFSRLGGHFDNHLREVHKDNRSSFGGFPLMPPIPPDPNAQKCANET